MSLHPLKKWLGCLVFEHLYSFANTSICVSSIDGGLTAAIFPCFFGASSATSRAVDAASDTEADETMQTVFEMVVEMFAYYKVMTGNLFEC